MTNVTSTSRNAYADIKPKLPTLHEKILGAFAGGAVRTRAEVANWLGLSTATTSGRCNELIKAGRLRRMSSKVQCHISGKTVEGLCRA